MSENTNTKKYQLLGPSGSEVADDMLKQCRDDEESLQWFQAIIADCLQMENLICPR